MEDKAQKLSLDNYLLGNKTPEPQETQRAPPVSHTQQNQQALNALNLKETQEDKYKNMSLKEKELEFARQEKELAKERDAEMERLKKYRSIYDDVSNDYLSMYEEKFQRERILQEVFYEKQDQTDQDVESKKPALFRKPSKMNQQNAPDFHEEYRNMSSDPKSFNELKEQYHVSEGNQIDHMNNEAFQMMSKALKEKQIRFYAFLNKEFNILNYKSARC
jgi:hypothetical protein